MRSKIYELYALDFKEINGWNPCVFINELRQIENDLKSNGMVRERKINVPLYIYYAIFNEGFKFSKDKKNLKYIHFKKKTNNGKLHIKINTKTKKLDIHKDKYSGIPAVHKSVPLTNSEKEELINYLFKKAKNLLNSINRNPNYLKIISSDYKNKNFIKPEK